MKCAESHKPKHHTEYIECEKVTGHEGPHAAFAKGQRVTWNDHDKRRKYPDLVSIERESLEALLAFANAEHTQSLDDAVLDAQRVLGHSLANGTPLRTAEEIIEERTTRRQPYARNILPARGSTLEAPRAEPSPQGTKRASTVNEPEENQSGAATTADVEREAHQRAMRDDDLPEAR